MAEQLKTFFSPELVRRLADDITRVHAAFPARAFIRVASAGLEELELLDRGKQIARALGAHLPEAYPEAIARINTSPGLPSVVPLPRPTFLVVSTVPAPT